MPALTSLLRRSAAAATAAACALGASGCSITGETADVRFCAVAEGSVSTQRADIRGDYVSAFADDLSWFAGQPGTSPFCLLLAVGNPASNTIAEAPVRSDRPHSPDADAEVRANVDALTLQFGEVLKSAKDEVGTPIAEALYTLASRGGLRAGDTIAVYSDMRQHTDVLKTVDLRRIRNPGAQAQAIDAALDRLAAAGLLPDGAAGRPSLREVRIIVPRPGASVNLTPGIDAEEQAARQVVAQHFWTAWAERVGADLRWGEPARGQRT